MAGTFVKRDGPAYIYTTWLAKLLGGLQCQYSAWARAHFKHRKYEESAADLVKWNRDHTKLMQARQRELEAEGWTCYVEDANAFKLAGAAAVVAGKPDLVAVKGDQVLLVDGKTGRERESDIWQVLIYLWALPKARPDLAGKTIEGEVYYRSGAVTLTPAELDDECREQLIDLIKVIGGDEAPPKRPSRTECRMCTIGPQDCPERVGAEQTTAVGDF